MAVATGWASATSAGGAWSASPPATSTATSSGAVTRPNMFPRTRLIALPSHIPVVAPRSRSTPTGEIGPEAAVLKGFGADSTGHLAQSGPGAAGSVPVGPAAGRP